MKRVEDTQNIEFPLLRYVGRVGEQCERSLHFVKLHRWAYSAYPFSDNRLLTLIEMQSDNRTEKQESHAFGATDLGLLLMALIWGVNYSVVKHGLKELSPYTFNGIRVALAALVLTLIALSVRHVKLPSRSDMWRMAGLGLMGNGIYQLLFIEGMARTRAGVAALVVAAGPAWIALISGWLGRERVSLAGWLGIALQLAGVACVVSSTTALDASKEAMLGAALIAGGSIMWALFSVLLQPYTTRAHPFHLSAITMSSGALLLVLVAVPGIVRLDFSTVSLVEWGTIVYAGVGALVIAYLLFYRGVRILGPTRTAMYGNLQPAIALLVAWIALSEQPTRWQIAGAVLIMVGLLVSRTARVSITSSNKQVAEKL